MIRILATIFTFIALLSTASIGDIKSDIHNMLLTPQEKEYLLEEKRLLEPVINRRLKVLSGEFKSKYEKLNKEDKDCVQQGLELLKEFNKKSREVRKPLQEIESKLSMDRYARELISLSRATPQQRLEYELNLLRSKVEQQQDELDELRNRQRRQRGYLFPN